MADTAEQSAPIVPRTVRAAAAIVTAQAAALVVTAAVLAVLAVVHTTTWLWGALAIIGFALLGAAVLAICARGLIRLHPSSRSPIVLVELICLPVTYSLGFQAGRILVAAPIMASAVAVLVLVFTRSAREGLDRVL
ncbi:MAG TPA: hypothetical protein VGH11_16090 [Jatrophihabitans sp.]